MITLPEAKLFLYTINVLAYVGILPFRCNVAEGKLERLSPHRFLFWSFCAFITAGHNIHTVIQALNLYVINGDDNAIPLQIGVMHMQYAWMVTVCFTCTLYLVMRRLDLTLLVFNELFKGQYLVNNNKARPMWKMPPIDMMMQTTFPSGAFYSAVGYASVIIFEREFPVELIHSPLLKSVKDSRLLIGLTGIIDVYACLFSILTQYFYVCLLYLCCEKLRSEVRGARNLLSCARPTQKLVRHAMKSARLTQFYISQASSVTRWALFTQKIAYVATAIACGYVVIRAFSENVPFGIFGSVTFVVAVSTWWITCFFASHVPDETEQLSEDIFRSYVPFFKTDVRTYMRSVRPAFVQDGAFRPFDRESFLLYVDFLVNQLVAVLLI